MGYNLTTEQIENIVIDCGVVYKNYGEIDEVILAPTKGGNSFVVEQEYKNIERDGARGKEKGLRRIIREDATLTVKLMGLSQDNLKLALAGAVKNVATGAITNGDGSIPDTDYLKNITLIGDTLGGDTKVITIYNALGDNGLSIEMTDKEESVVEIAFSANYNPSDLSEPIYKIEEVEGGDTYTVTFTIDDGTTAIVGATVNFDDRSITTIAGGIAAFTGVSIGNNKTFSINAGGYQTYFGSVNVVNADVTQTVSMTGI